MPLEHSQKFDELTSQLKWVSGRRILFPQSVSGICLFYCPRQGLRKIYTAPAVLAGARLVRYTLMSQRFTCGNTAPIVST